MPEQMDSANDRRKDFMINRNESDINDLTTSDSTPGLVSQSNSLSSLQNIYEEIVLVELLAVLKGTGHPLLSSQNWCHIRKQS
jgi:hypothetical protein